MKPRQPRSWDHQLRTARRTRHVLDSRANRVQIIILACAGLIAAAHMLDRVAAGITACGIEKLAQCPEFTK